MNAHHNFNVDVAIEYGVDQAIMIANFQFWISHNASNKKNFYEGKYWTYNSYKALSLVFPYWSEKQVRRILNDLLGKSVLIAGNFNERDYDNTKWYAFSDDLRWLGELNLPPSAQMGKGKKAYDHLGTTLAPMVITPAQTGKGSSAQTGKPIPDSKQVKTDNKPDIKLNENDAEFKNSALPNSFASAENCLDVPPVALPPQDLNIEVISGDKLPKGLFRQMNDAYFIWFRKISNGNDPKFSAAEGKALKEMVWYFYQGVVKRVKEKMEICNHDEICNRATNAFIYVLNGLEAHSKIDSFLKAGKKLVQINSNLTNIIDQLKNGNPKTNQQQQQPGFGGKPNATDHYSAMEEQLERERK